MTAQDRDQEIWSFAADAGDVIAGTAIGNQRLALRLLANKQVRKPYCHEIQELSFVFRVDGELAAWHFEGCERLRLNRKGRYITVDIGVPESRWNVSDESALRRYIAGCVSEGVGLMAAKLKRERFDVAETRLRKHTVAFLDAYVARRWPEHPNLY